MKGKLELGTPIESHCTACKQDQPHVVETLKTDGTINKVRCKSCDAVHVYRKPKSAPDEGKKGGSSKKRKKLDAAVSDAEASKAKPYAMDSAFAVGDVLEHKRFGFGRVVATKPGGKMEVAFQDGGRILVCKDAGPSGRRALRAVPKPVEVEVEVEAGEEADTETDEVADASEDE